MPGARLFQSLITHISNPRVLSGCAFVGSSCAVLRLAWWLLPRGWFAGPNAGSQRRSAKNGRDARPVEDHTAPSRPLPGVAFAGGGQHPGARRDVRVPAKRSRRFVDPLFADPHQADQGAGRQTIPVRSYVCTAVKRVSIRGLIVVLPLND